MTTPRHRALKAVLILMGLASFLVVLLMQFVDPGLAGLMRTAPHAVVIVFTILSEFGTHYWYWPPAFVLAVVFTVLSHRMDPSPQRRLCTWIAEATGFLFVVAAVANAVIGVTKRLVGRARPYVDVPPNGPRFEMFASSTDHWSFPSGHAATFFAVGMVAAFLFPRWRWPILTFAVLGAFSRVVIGMHYLSDVLAGGTIGVVAAVLVREVFADRRWTFIRRADGTIAPKRWRP